MNTFKLFLITILVTFSANAIAQKSTYANHDILKLLNKDSGIDNSFKERATDLHKSYLDSSFWSNGSKITNLQVMNQMNNFEKAIANGKGGKTLTQKDVITAKQKFPGTSGKATRSRFKMYILQMERVHEDE